MAMSPFPYLAQHVAATTADIQDRNQLSGINSLQSLLQPMESWAVSQRPDVHNFEAPQTILEVLEADVVGIHHLWLITAATEILTHHFTLFSL